MYTMASSINEEEEEGKKPLPVTAELKYSSTCSLEVAGYLFLQFFGSKRLHFQDQGNEEPLAKC